MSECQSSAEVAVQVSVWMHVLCTMIQPLIQGAVEWLPCATARAQQPLSYGQRCIRFGCVVYLFVRHAHCGGYMYSSPAGVSSRHSSSCCADLLWRWRWRWQWLN
jgi:hypothetical protein